MTAALIEYRGVAKAFAGQVVLRDMTLAIERGEIWATGVDERTV